MANWSQTAFIFPGQGSQIVSMGKDIAETYDFVADLFKQADTLINYPLSSVMFNGPKETLDITWHTQPAVYLHSVAMLRALQHELPEARAAFMAGHSLGELTALTAAESLTFETGMRLVRERGRLMHEAGQRESGGMAALLGLQPDQVRAICQQASQQTGKPIVLANDNCPGQIVVSGDIEALEAALELAQEAGARRAIRLAVSTAPHSPLMQPAQTDFDDVLKETEFQIPQVPVYANSSAKPLTTVADIREELDAQLTHPVHWTATIQKMIADGVTHFVEIGPADVLTGLVRRIDRNVQRSTVNSLETLRAFVATHA